MDLDLTSSLEIPTGGAVIPNAGTEVERGLWPWKISNITIPEATQIDIKHNPTSIQYKDLPIIILSPNEQFD